MLLEHLLVVEIMKAECADNRVQPVVRVGRIIPDSQYLRGRHMLIV